MCKFFGRPSMCKGVRRRFTTSQQSLFSGDAPTPNFINCGSIIRKFKVLYFHQLTRGRQLSAWKCACVQNVFALNGRQQATPDSIQNATD